MGPSLYFVVSLSYVCIPEEEEDRQKTDLAKKGCEKHDVSMSTCSSAPVSRAS